jgi:5-methylcytosine-specific restriction protein A
MIKNFHVEAVPAHGPLSLGAVYKRSDLHNRFHGNRNAGIVPSKREPAVLLFHTHEPAQQFYQDGFDKGGVYWYSGEGTKGDMKWTPANSTVRDHDRLGLDLLLFQRVQRKDGLWRFIHLVWCIGYEEQNRRDKVGRLRRAIIFSLLPVAVTHMTFAANQEGWTKSELKFRASGGDLDLSRPTEERIRALYERSAAVQWYALSRADGTCEACGQPSPFCAASGEPFLEVHQLDRLADVGPGRVERVAAVCPNCHMRCHYSADSTSFNSGLRARIATLESTA